MTENDVISDILQDAKNGNVYDFKDKVKTFIQTDVDKRAKEFIDSGDAFDSFIQSDRFQNESSIDMIDIATNLFDQFKLQKNRDELIKKELVKKKYSIKDISKIMKMISKL